ncbi:hypothetical protein PDIDSM_6574 [Penicillium digitatum]|nr:hypothetical protein PDIDSM_6574 [Penicillium digitatum]
MHLSNSMLLMTALTAGSAVARLHGHDRRHAHPKDVTVAQPVVTAPAQLADVEKRGEEVFATIDGKLVSWINNWFGDETSDVATKVNQAEFAVAPTSVATSTTATVTWAEAISTASAAQSASSFSSSSSSESSSSSSESSSSSSESISGSSGSSSSSSESISGSSGSSSSSSESSSSSSSSESSSSSSSSSSDSDHDSSFSISTSSFSSSSSSHWASVSIDGTFSIAGFGSSTSSKRVGSLDWDYIGNVGSPWGSNIIRIEEGTASQYKHVIRFENDNSKAWTVVMWNSYGPSGGLNGFWSPNQALKFTVEPGNSIFVAIDDDSQGGWGAAEGENLPTNYVGQYASTWGEFDMSNSQNNGFSGWDVSCIIAQLADMHIAGMRICNHEGEKCSSISQGASSVVNGYTSADQGKPDKAVTQSAGPVRLVVDLGWSS